VEFVRELQELTRDIDRNKIELFAIPSFTAIKEARASVHNGLVKIGAQNVCWEDEGQFTGEISPVMLKESGADLVMIGHSERRNVFAETDGQENKKVLRALKHGFTTLLCVGETWEQKNYGVSDEILRMQLKIGLFGINKRDAGNLWIAYEPVWAIGTSGVPASTKYAMEKHALIKRTLRDILGESCSLVPVLHGGSVNDENARELFETPGIDGLFVGRAAWDAKNFNRLVRAALDLP
jgi:triosephosphate isomerase